MSEPERASPALPRTLTSATTVASALVVIAVLVIALQQLSALLQPLFIAIFFFYLGRPLARKLTAYHVPSFLANLAIIAVALAALALLTWLITVHVDDLKAKAPLYNQQFQEVVRQGVDAVALRVPMARAQLDELAREALTTGPVSWVLKAVLGTLVGSLTGTLLFAFYLLFLNEEAVTLPRRLRSAYGERRAQQLLEIGENINNGIIRYIYVKSVASLLVAALTTALLFAYRADFALLWGTLALFGNFVPIIGSFVAVLLPVLIVLLQYGSFGTAVGLALLLILCQSVVANYIEPSLAGQRLNLSPLVVMLSLAFWGWLWGVVGLLIAVPIMMSVKLVLENIPATHQIAILLSQSPPAAPGVEEARPATSGETPGVPL